MGACPACGATATPGQQFCGSCGARLAAACRTCRAPLTPGLRYCTSCGTPVNADDDGTPDQGPLPRPEAERRLCSVLFVDLVGFTPLSEGRDPEEVRELLGSYFAVAREVVGRYGGTIEKFIGDAVMAVWGTPVAAEGDAERAVRAGLDLLAGVTDLGASIGAPGLGARAGIVTGTVATTPGADGQAMVAGDAVNTAARIQSAAPVGAVLVDATTRRLTAAAIDYDEHGEVALKGKAGPEPLWRARQVVSGIGGAQRSDGLEGPFVGRAVEFRLVKDLLHTTTEERRPRLVVVGGPAGVGKTRLGWELEKYVDGLAETVFWHRGRCPRFGEDTAYGALAEIVRARLGVGDDDDPGVVDDKLTGFLRDLFDTDAERTYVGARLARLLGVADGLADGLEATELTQAELFAGWRRFFEQLAEQATVLLVVEDLHDADEGLLDFLEHLADWTRDLPLLVIGFARPELLERRPGLGSGRGRTLVTLTPLSEPAMRELLAGLVAQLPAEAAKAIEAQAQGIPLYAVETVRSLIDREVVVASPTGYTMAGELGPLGVPETLHGLLASRLDALDPVARALAGDASVVGASFTADLLDAVSDLNEAQVRTGLAELTRRDVLQVNADALSPHVGSYEFSHGLLAQVAYQTLSRRDLKARHLRVAEHLAASPRNKGDAIAEVVARHYLEALAARPNDPDLAELRSTALHWLERAGERATSTGAQATAARLLVTAAELTGEADETAALSAAALWLRAGRAQLVAADFAGALGSADRAVTLRGRYGHARLVAAAQALRGFALHRLGRTDQGRAVLVQAAAVLEEEPAEDTVEVLAVLAATYSLSGLAEADDVTQRALLAAQELGSDERLLIDVLIQRGLFLSTKDRSIEAVALLREALLRAEALGSVHDRIRCSLNISDAVSWFDPAEGLRYGTEAMTLARQHGHRFYLAYCIANACLCALRTGDWDLAEQVVTTGVADDGLGDLPAAALSLALVLALRGQADRARQVLVDSEGQWDPQEDAYPDYVQAVLAEADGDLAGALRHAVRAAHTSAKVGLHSDGFVAAWPLATRLALATVDLDATRSLLALTDAHPLGLLPPIVRAERSLALALLTEDRGRRLSEVESAVGEVRAAGAPYHLGHALLDLAEVRAAVGRPAVDQVAEATAIAAGLGAASLAARAAGLAGGLSPGHPQPHAAARTAP